MSYSFKIVDGDLNPRYSSCDVVEGQEKLLQDLKCWLVEELGNDRFHPGFGSILDSKVGESSDILLMSAEIKGEIYRVLQNYQTVLSDKISREKWTYVNEHPDEGYWLITPEEVLSKILDVKVKAVQNTLFVHVELKTMTDVIGFTYAQELGV